MRARPGQIVMHVDMDAFYVSVEQRRDPGLRGRPVIVGGSPRGVVLSASYEARALGVRSGMASTQARRLAPQAVFVPPDFDAYTAVSVAIVEVFRTVSAVVESASIDEAYLDLTGAVRLFGSPAAIGERVRAMVADEQQITCSVGIGPSKFVAKVASRQAKPDGLIEVPADGVTDFLHPLPVEAMFGVGPATARRLHDLGITTVADLARTPRASLRGPFGPHAGGTLHALSWGRDGSRVVDRPPERSIGSQETLGRDTDEPAVVRRELLRMADRTASRMRKARLVGRTVALSLRFADFSEVTRSATVATPTDVTEEIYAEALGLYERLALDRPRIRRVGVRVEGLVSTRTAHQQPRLTDPERGWPEAERAADAAVLRFGPGAVQRAVLTRGRGPGQAAPNRQSGQSVQSGPSAPSVPSAHAG